MNFKLHDNGWTIYIDEDIKLLNEYQAHQVAKMIVNNMVVVFRNQDINPEEELKFCSMIGEYQYYPPNVDRIKHIRVNEGILRVTAQKNEYGEEGLFGHKAALDWHANQASNLERKPLIWLYSKQGSKGSRTSWLNNILSYEGLPDDLKDQIKNIKVYCGYKSGSYSTSNFFKEHIDRTNPIPLVQVNKEGRKGLFFPFLQIFGFENYSDQEFESMMDILKQHVLKEQYIYHHDWADNDIVISEQWLSIHKRWDFKSMETRVLHRIAFDYSKVYK